MTMTPMSHTTLPAGTLRLPRPFTHSRGTGRRQQWATAPRASKEGPESGAVVNEELLAKLKASQEEAERLKRELAAAQASVRRSLAAGSGADGRGRLGVRVCGASSKALIACWLLPLWLRCHPVEHLLLPVQSGAAAAERPAPAAKRIDSGDLRRETLFTTGTAMGTGTIGCGRLDGVKRQRLAEHFGRVGKL